MVNEKHELKKDFYAFMRHQFREPLTRGIHMDNLIWNITEYLSDFIFDHSIDKEETLVRSSNNFTKRCLNYAATVAAQQMKGDENE